MLAETLGIMDSKFILVALIHLMLVVKTIQCRNLARKFIVEQILHVIKMNTFWHWKTNDTSGIRLGSQAAKRGFGLKNLKK